MAGPYLDLLPCSKLYSPPPPLPNPSGFHHIYPLPPPPKNSVAVRSTLPPPPLFVYLKRKNRTDAKRKGWGKAG